MGTSCLNSLKPDKKTIIDQDYLDVSYVSDVSDFSDMGLSTIQPRKYTTNLQAKIQNMAEKEKRIRKNTKLVKKHIKKVDNETKGSLFMDQSMISTNMTKKQEKRFQKSKEISDKQRMGIRANLKKLQKAMELFKQDHKYGDNEEVVAANQQAKWQVGMLLKGYEEQEKAYDELDEAYDRLEKTFIEKSQYGKSFMTKSENMENILEQDI